MRKRTLTRASQKLSCKERKANKSEILPKTKYQNYMFWVKWRWSRELYFYASEDSICQAVASVKLWEMQFKDSSRSVSLETHIFAAIFLRFPTAPCFTVQTGQGLGVGWKYFRQNFSRKTFAALVCCVVSCVRRRHSNQTAGSVKSALLTQLFQFVGLVWFLVSRQNQTKPKQAKAGGTIEASGGFIKGGHETLMLYLRAAIGISLEEQC